MTGVYIDASGKKREFAAEWRMNIIHLCGHEKGKTFRFCANGGKIARILDKSVVLWYDILYMCIKQKRTDDGGRERSGGV